MATTSRSKRAGGHRHARRPHAATTPQRAARRAVGWIDTTQYWLGTNMAALMRQVAEQSFARTWWDAIHPDQPTADIADVLAEWIPNFYNVHVVAKQKQTVVGPTGKLEDDGSISTAADLISQLLVDRARILAEAPIYLLMPDVMKVVLTLAHTDTYHEYIPTEAALPTSTGHISLATPIPRHRVPATHQPVADNDPILPDPFSDDGPSSELLCGITWHAGTSDDEHVVRADEWIVTQAPDGSGVDSIDQTAKRLMNGPDRAHQVAPMLFSGEWFLPFADEPPEEHAAGEAVSAARSRVSDAFAEVGSGQCPVWDGGSIDDSRLLLSTLTLRVVWDAITAGLVLAQHVHVPNPGSAKNIERPAHRVVIVLTAPPSPPHATKEPT